MQRQVTVPSSRSAPRGLPVRSGGPVTSRTSSSSWKATPIRSPNAASAARRSGPLACERPELAGGAEQHRGLQPAALQVALDRRPRVQASARCISSPAASSELRARQRPGTASTEPAAPARRTRARTAGRRSRSPAGRPPAATTVGPAAAQRRAVEHVVVDERRASGRARRRPRRAAAPSVSGGGSARGQEHAAAAAAACRRRRSSRRRGAPAARRGRWPARASRCSSAPISRAAGSPPASTTA